MSSTRITRSQNCARMLCDHLTVAQHYELHLQTRHAVREMEDADVWLRLTAEAMGYKLVKKDPVGDVLEKVNALALGVR